jgi:hypothetical protein
MMTNKALMVFQKKSALSKLLPEIEKAMEAVKTIKPIKELEAIAPRVISATEPIERTTASAISVPAHGVHEPSSYIAKETANQTRSRTGGIRSSVPPAQTVASARKNLTARSGEPLRPKTAGVVDRTVKEIADLQWGYRFQRNPYAEANDSPRSRNFINYEGPGGTKMADLKEKVKEGLKDEEEGHKYWMNVAKLLNSTDMKLESREAVHKAGQEDQHHALLEKIKLKMEKRSELEKYAFIRHEGGKYNVYSHTGKRMGSYTSEGEAKHRLQQIEYFKKHGGLPTISQGPGPEIWQESPGIVNTLEKGGSLEMNIYLKNRKTLLS